MTTNNNNPTYTDNDRHNAPMSPYGGLCCVEIAGVGCYSITTIKTRHAAVFALIYNNRRAGAIPLKGNNARVRMRKRPLPLPTRPEGWGRGRHAAYTASGVKNLDNRKKKKEAKKKNWHT